MTSPFVSPGEAAGIGAEPPATLTLRTAPLVARTVGRSARGVRVTAPAKPPPTATGNQRHAFFRLLR